MNNYIKLMEMAGTLEKHVKDEKKLFSDVCEVLQRLEKFCTKQHENNVYSPISKEAKKLCEKLENHLTRYCAKD